MAAVPPKKPGLTGKKLPKWAIGLIVVVGAYLTYRVYEAYKNGSSSSAASSPAATDAGTTDSGGASSTPDDSSNEDLANALNGLTTLLGSGSFTTPTISPSPGFIQGNPPNPVTPAPTPGTGDQPGGPVVPGFTSVTPSAPGAQVPTGQQLAETTGTGDSRVFPGAENLTPPAAVSNTITGENFGGITAVKTLAGGATLTTFATGRQVEQAPGKTAYVVKK